MGLYGLKTEMNMEIEVKTITFHMGEAQSPDSHYFGRDAKTHKVVVDAIVRLKNLGFESNENTTLTVELPCDAEVCTIIEEQILARLGEIRETYPNNNST